MTPNLAAPSGSSVARYGQNPSLFATSSSSFGSGSSVLPKYEMFGIKISALFMKKQHNINKNYFSVYDISSEKYN